MPMRSGRWTAVSQSAFEWERDALDFLREHLPDHEPWRAWSNFEFIDDEGRVNEVDVLVLTPVGLVLIEVKSRPGTLRGDAYSWTWITEGRQVTTDNPLPLANRKAKRLASVLRRQEVLGRGSSRAAPWIEPLIFLSAVRKNPVLDPGTEKRVVLRGSPGAPDDVGVIGTLLQAHELGLARRGTPDIAVTRSWIRAIEQAGIRAPGRGRRVGDYELGQLLGEGENWQDFAARHAATGVNRRVRIYPYARAATPEARDRLARTAQREFRVLEGVEHAGIQGVRDYREAELGPALIFEHDPNAVRLDRYLAQKVGGLSLAQRLALIRQLGEAMAYAHGKRIYHRGLAPQSILVRDPEGDTPRLQITNWQVASRGGGTSAGTGVTSGTQHIEDHLADPAKAYLAPEAIAGGDESAARADVFALGAIAYHILTGRAPVTNPLDLPTSLRDGNGLLISSAMNGAGRWLEEMVRVSTAPVVRDRPRDAREFLDYLAEAEKEALPAEPMPSTTVDPAIAGPDDLLDGSLSVKRRLGQGGSADVLLVQQEGGDEELVLKVALDDAHADRIRAEADVLRRLHHQNIVRFVAEVETSGRPAILMERAGDKTLAQWIRGGDPLSLDLMRRFGEHLLSAIEHLEQEGIAHRDIKPDNIGISKTPGSGAYRLVLFDFSLSRAPVETITAGTRPYLEPFLPDRKPPRWDLHAERYAAAVTLHEMLAGAPPSFGDGLTDPRLTDDEATIAVDRFDPSLRDGLAAFFSRALRRDPAERFGNSEEMLRVWQEAFSALDRAKSPEDSIELIARRLDRSSNIAEVGYGVEARAVLDQMGIHTVHQLLGVPRLKFRYLTGVGDRIRREIRERAKRLAQLRPDLVPGGTIDDGDGRASVDRLAEQLLPRRPAGDERQEDRILAYYLGIDDDAPAWPSAGDVAVAVGTARSAVADALEAARDRWHKSADLNALRSEIHVLLASAGGVATGDELTAQVLAARGSVEDDERQRSRRARAIVRAAVELEAAVLPVRFAAHAESAGAVLIAALPEAAEYARRLARRVDALAAEDPLPSPGRVEEELGLAPVPEGAGPLTAERRLRLAVAASKGAALSARGELYPRGMPAITALRLSLGALAGPEVLREDQVRARVRGRFPEASPLPPRPELDILLDQVDAGRVWSEPAGGEAGYHARTVSSTGTGTMTIIRQPTFAPAAEVTPEVLNARAIEDKIAYAAERGIFLALTVEPRRARDAEAELLRRFARQTVSLERLMLRSMRTEAEARRVQWPKALAADAASRDSTDFKNLLRLASKAAVRVKEDVLALRTPTLLTRPGLVARYDLMEMLVVFSQASGTAGGPPSIWLLIPQAEQGLPQIDGAVLPVISAANWARLTESWLANAHRAGGGRSAA
ncbi:BREX system serine/threonine kinase PglW [Mesorhizobium captivum]|uniref:BREX system serine/threonine kinase PglW n=1 Tax=Mesorhizobium captivum TaxID=3072319 RepID=UPI002A24D8C0|nr:BREX system serine/threonine kinase PglW [Mesorhizobium sp. VK22E]MDX8506141.1 BREX system serine/threonine kinase PglW [Mesorhizobium sp. VK22E]